MPEKKKQHYVPVFLLKNFSADEENKLINIFNPTNSFYRKNCPLKNQGQEDYFYGSDGILEDALGKVETNIAPVISKIIQEKSIPKRDSLEYKNLFFFTMLLAYRTKNTVEKMNGIADKAFQEIKKLDARFSDPKYDDLIIELTNPAALSLGIISKQVWHAYDLELALLVNTTKNKFFISDHPVNLYNQYLECRKHPGGHLGMLTKGLQLFFPLSPDCMLVYYDKWAYKFGNKKDTIIHVQDKNDIKQLNYLQIVNCTNVIYTNNDIIENNLLLMANKSRALRLKDRTVLYELNKRMIDDNGNENIQYVQHGDDRKTKLTLSFVKQREAAKSHVLSNFAVQLRNEALRHLRS